MGVDHYENFPVASIVLPKRFRPAVTAIYRFARDADDVADEGDAPPDVRESELQSRTEELNRIERGEQPLGPIYRDLATHIQAHALPTSLFHDLLDAFRQDVRKNQYEDYSEVLDYCRRSANPIGRLLLHLYGAASPDNLEMSDRICTSLQVINFLQDIDIDLQRNRIYMPRQELQRFDLDPASLAAQCRSAEWRAFIDFQVRRARRLLWAGAPLARRLPGRLGVELRLIVLGGDRILTKVLAVDGDVFHRRPILGPTDWIVMTARSLLDFRAPRP